MSRAADTGSGEGERGVNETPELRPAPQWLLDSMRPVIRGLSRALWRISYKGVENIPAEGGLVVAAVRAARTGPDGIPRLHLEFIDRQWPLEGIE